VDASVITEDKMSRVNFSKIHSEFNRTKELKAESTACLPGKKLMKMGSVF
jgi:hypothetical protein